MPVTALKLAPDRDPEGGDRDSSNPPNAGYGIETILIRLLQLQLPFGSNPPNAGYGIETTGTRFVKQIPTWVRTRLMPVTALKRAAARTTGTAPAPGSNPPNAGYGIETPWRRHGRRHWRPRRPRFEPA